MNDFSLKIGAHNIAVIYKSREALDDYDEDDGYCIHGMFNPDGKQRVIWLADDITGTHYMSVFIHELIEAINQIYELCLTHSQISQISEILTQIWVDNQKTLVDHLDL